MPVESGHPGRPRCVHRLPWTSRDARRVTAMDRPALTPAYISVALTPVSGQFGAEAALVVFRHDRPLHLVALVQEGQPEGEGEVAENAGVLGPGHHRARRHHGRDVAVDEAGAGQIGERDHGADLAPALVVVVARHLGEDDLDLGVVRQIVQRRDDVPAVHLALVDLLRAVIEAGGVAEPDRVRGREQPERRVRPDHPVLVEQGQLALDLEHALDHEHDVGPAGVVLVEAQRHRVLQRPGQDALAELGHLLVVAQHDRVLADQVDAADVAVEIDPDAGPVEPRTRPARHGSICRCRDSRRS